MPLRGEYVRMQGAQWEDDSATNQCRQCGEQFGLFKRKHHCRQCGRIFCSNCSSHTKTIPAFQFPVRVCDTCLGRAPDGPPPPESFQRPYDSMRPVSDGTAQYPGHPGGVDPRSSYPQQHSISQPGAQPPGTGVGGYPSAGPTQPPVHGASSYPTDMLSMIVPQASAPPADDDHGAPPSTSPVPQQQGASYDQPPSYAEHQQRSAPGSAPQYQSSYSTSHHGEYPAAATQYAYASDVAQPPAGSYPAQHDPRSVQPPVASQYPDQPDPRAPHPAAGQPPYASMDFQASSSQPAAYSSIGGAYQQGSAPAYHQQPGSHQPQYGAQPMAYGAQPSAQSSQPAANSSASSFDSFSSISSPELTALRETFYQVMVDQATSVSVTVPGVDASRPSSELTATLTAITLVELLSVSRGRQGLRLLSGEMKPSGCPPEMREFMQALMQLKPKVGKLSATEVKILKAECAVACGLRLQLADRMRRVSIQKGLGNLAQVLHTISMRVIERGAFKQVIRDVLEFTQGALGRGPGSSSDSVLQSTSAPVAQPAPSVNAHGGAPLVMPSFAPAQPASSGGSHGSSLPDPSRVAGVTEEMVRETFYSAMYESLITSGLFTVGALEDQDPFIFIAMSAHALVDVVSNSRGVSGGMQLVSGKVLTVANCPPAFSEMLKGMLMFKHAFDQLSPEQILMIKHTSIDDDEVPMPPHLNALKTPQLMELAQRVNGVATKISQRPEFQAIINHVISLGLAVLRGG